MDLLFFCSQSSTRFTPSGSPLLLLSVIDYQLIDQLIKEGNFDRETHEANYHRIITEGVSREVCVIRTSSTEEVDYLRFVLRWNSTRMRRTAWQSKNLPRGDDSPWRATLVSLLYGQDVCRCLQWTGILTNSEMLNDMLSLKRSTCCANCSIKKIQLNRCGRCKTVFYCSRECQKNHWSSHKKVCGYKCEHLVEKKQTKQSVYKYNVLLDFVHLGSFYNYINPILSCFSKFRF